MGKTVGLASARFIGGTTSGKTNLGAPWASPHAAAGAALLWLEHLPGSLKPNVLFI